MTPTAGRWTRNGWVAGVAAAAVVVGVVAGVQLATGGSDPDSGAAVPEASQPALDSETVPTAGGSIAAAAELFPADTEAADIVRTSTVDLGAAWPVRSCVDPGAPDAGRVDFVLGAERGPDYSRDLAIGWYADADAARVAYDGLLATLARCASDSGARLATAPAALGVAAAVVTVVGASDSPSGDLSDSQSTYAVSVDGAVVVLASDHAETIATDTTAPVAFEGTAGQAERLLTEACRIDAGSCA